MDAPRTADTGRKPRTSVYESYAQLVKMLLPSSGCLAIYTISGGVVWCSDGFERPEFREIVDAFRGRHRELALNRGVIRETSAGVTALIARLGENDQREFGYALIELGETHSSAARSMAESMTLPIFHCLSSQLGLEHSTGTEGGETPSQPATESAVPSADRKRLEFLLGVAEIDLNSAGALRSLLQHCVEHFECLSAAFCIPEHEFTEVAESSSADAETLRQLNATRKHLLAWAQLNNRPMVVNRVDAGKSPCKILSCPVVDGKQASRGLIALFRGSEGPDFELPDVALIRFLARQGMALLTERQDAASGLMSRAAFERYLDERLDRSGPTGALLYLDIDDLKVINESFGYPAGDDAILRTAQLIHRFMNPGESACRLSADRFVVHLPERERDKAMSFGYELASVARSLGYAVGGRRVPLSFSFGVAAASDSVTGSRHWIAAAELACQRARTESPPSPYNANSYRADV